MKADSGEGRDTEMMALSEATAPLLSAGRDLPAAHGDSAYNSSTPASSGRHVSVSGSSADVDVEEAGRGPSLESGPKSWKSTLGCLVLGQALSILVTITAVSSSLLASDGVSIPASQSLLNYMLLAFCYGVPLVLRHRSNLRALLPSLPIFAATSCLDVAGNYLVVLAFRYTSLTSVALLDCWAIPCAMLLTSYFLRVRYTRWHAIGALLCTGGLACLLFSDAHASDRAQVGPAPVLGDSLVILGASLYAGSNVLVEYLGKETADPSTVLGMLGGFGSFFSMMLLLIFERQELQELATAAQLGTLGQVWAPFVAFSLALFGFYSLVPRMLVMGGAAFFNLSLLTSDMWAVGVSALWFHQFVGPLYFVALTSVAVGLSIYSTQPESAAPKDPFLEGKADDAEQ